MASDDSPFGSVTISTTNLSTLALALALVAASTAIRFAIAQFDRRNRIAIDYLFSAAQS